MVPSRPSRPSRPPFRALPWPARRGVVLSATALALAGCSAAPDVDDVRAQRAASPPRDAGADGDAGVALDQVEIVRGVPSRGRDPGVVALALDGGGLCSGALVSPRLVLTARHCVARTVETVECPASGVQVLGPRSASAIEVLYGDDVDTAVSVARGAEIVAPDGVTLCEADIALVVLDRPVTLAKPLPVRPLGPAVGDRVRSVGYGKRHEADRGGKKLVREHVPIVDVAFAEFRIGEGTCQGDSGGPALDESTSEIVGVVSRGGPSCEGPDVHNVYTRVDTFAWLVEEGFRRLVQLERREAGTDGGAPDDGDDAPKRGTKTKPPTDVGGACAAGADCAAGICLEDGARRYCTRTCGAGDRCPTNYHCRGVSAGRAVCLNVR